VFIAVTVYKIEATLIVEDRSIVAREWKWVKHNRDSSHFGRKVMECLEENCQGGNIKLFAVLAQPAWSCDLNKSHLISLGLVQSVVYRKGKPETIQHLVTQGAVSVRTKWDIFIKNIQCRDAGQSTLTHRVSISNTWFSCNRLIQHWYGDTEKMLHLLLQ
jgi:hypothetical protein